MKFKIANILVSVMALGCSNAKANEGGDLTPLAAEVCKPERQAEKKAIFTISSRESTVRKDADVKDRDEGIASAISEERSLIDALCSRSIPDEIVKVAEKKGDLSNYLQNRIDKTDKRYASFLMALALLEERGARTLVETGSSRFGSGGFKGDGGSTIIFGDWAAQNKAMVHSIDNNFHHIDAAKNAAQAYLQNLSFACCDSIEFLNKFSNPIDFLYLDSYDFELNNPVPSQEHHLNELVAAYPCLHEKSIVMIDDCDFPHGGMGKLVIDHLKESGWEVVYSGYQVILLRE